MIETMTNEEKYHFLINQIIHLRKKSVQIIQKQFKNFYLTKLNMKKILLIQNLLQKSNSSIIKIVSIIKSYIIRKKVQNYLSKVKTSFVITNELNMEKNMQLKVFFGNIIKIFNFEYDSFLDKFAIYIPRNKITKKEYNINFISNGKIIIDPHYFTTEINGYFVNVINFDIIKKKELEKVKEKEQEIRFYCYYLRDNGINIGNESGFSSLNTSVSSIRNNNMWNSHQDKLNIYYKNKKFYKPKSILKVSEINGRRRISEKKNIKKVRFGNVEFSF